MNNIMIVQVRCRRHKLKHKSFGLGGEERFGIVFEQGLEIVFDEVED